MNTCLLHCSFARFVLISVSFGAVWPAEVRGQDADSKVVVEYSGKSAWYKGNLHAHSLWSDGDDFPEMIAAWYRERDYNFLALSDHNVLSEGQRWMPLTSIEKRADSGILDRYRQRFGPAWVETQAGDSGLEVRLKPLNEFRCLVESAGEFIMIQGEEISDSVGGSPVHMNVSNVLRPIRPAGGEDVREAMRNNIRQVLSQERETGREMLIHLNHPNFHYAITAEDLASVIEEQFYEVYNGHPGVNHLGDDEHPSVEQIWDIVNAIRLHALNAAPIYGIGTDDSHEYHGQPGSRPGRGWVMVRAQYLTPEHLIKSLEAGDFYASSGVVLGDVHYDAQHRLLTVHIEPQPGANFKTEFIATLRDEPSNSASNESRDGGVANELPKRLGVVVAESDGLVAKYQLTGEELYVRARITSSQPPEDPVYDGQKQQAWTQPVGWELEQ